MRIDADEADDRLHPVSGIPLPPVEDDDDRAVRAALTDWFEALEEAREVAREVKRSRPGPDWQSVLF